MNDLIYLDNHATTRVDPRVIDSMRALDENLYANAGSTTHLAGQQVAELVASALQAIADELGCVPDELVLTSGATESINLAIAGFCLHRRQKRRCIVSAPTEHRAVLDVLERLRNQGFEIRWLPVRQQGDRHAGCVEPDAIARLVTDEVALVSVMLANNEIGTVQPMTEIAKHCRLAGAMLHADASQAVGHIDIDVDTLDVDLLSFSAHKFYGPKGVGGLFVRQRLRSFPILPQIVGGGQQANRRSGTINSTGVVGMANAMQRCRELAASERPRIQALRDRLWTSIVQVVPELEINGPDLEEELRLGRNLNLYWPGVEGQSLMLACPNLCISSGSACTSTDSRPSHVLQAIGRSSDQARCSLRFGLGRFTTSEEIESAVEQLSQAYRTLQKMVQ